MHEIGNDSFMIAGIRIVPLPVMHYELPIVGFRIGNLAYITDAKTIPDKTFDLMKRS